MIIFILIGFAVLLGLSLLLIGWRGKLIDEHPLCRKCKYDLVGTEQLPTNCPECGSELNKPRATRIGNRKRKRALLVGGLVIFVSSLTTGSFLGWAQAKNFDWYPYKPLWMLQSEIEKAASGTAKQAESELLRRLEDNELSQHQIKDVVDDALLLQADTNKVWNRLWGNFIETAWTQEKVSHRQISQYLKTATASGLQLFARSKVRQGTRMPVKRGFSNPRAGTEGRILVSRNYLRMMIADTNIAKGQSGSGIGPLSTGGSWGTGSYYFDLPLGHHTLTLECRFRAVPNGIIHQDKVFKMEGDEREKFIEEHMLLDWISEIAIPIEVIAVDEPVIELVDDPALENKIRSAINLMQCKLIENRRGYRLRTDLKFDALPMPVAFDVYWRSGEREWLAYRVTALETEGSLEYHFPRRNNEQFPEDVTHVDVIFRSSSETAELEVGLERIWQGEIVFPNQPLEVKNLDE